VGAAASPEVLRIGAFPARHAFATRRGGVSCGPYASLNLSASTGDDPAHVEENRRRLTIAFGADPARLAGVRQVHGTRVVDASEAGEDVAADALVASEPGWTLRISVADCVPLLLAAPERGVVAAVHAGWRGTAAGIVAATLSHLHDRFGVRPGELHAAIGPAISGPRYQVGPEVVLALREAGAPASVATADAEADGRYRVSVPEAVRALLIRGGVAADRIHAGRWCTASDPERFYSHRRDAGRTGRHWALIATPEGAGPTLGW
jgi:YfiH family protein